MLAAGFAAKNRSELRSDRLVPAIFWADHRPYPTGSGGLQGQQLRAMTGLVLARTKIGRGGMEQHSILVKELKFIKPIRCDSCGGKARLIRRSPHRIKGSEVRVFECRECGYQTTEVVNEEANSLPLAQ
jgi:Zn ribbon nucleic-acid-binding protein